jgi:hypothetical protein
MSLQVSAIVLMLIALSGLADSLGLVYAARIWGMTIGVVVFSGRFFAWPRLEQAVATPVLVGLVWLLVRTVSSASRARR